MPVAESQAYVADPVGYDDGQTEPSEQFFFVADGLPLNVRLSLRDYIGNWIQSASAGSVLHFVRTPDHKVLGTLEIPTETGRSRRRDPSLVQVLPLINSMLLDSSPVPDDFRGQLALDRLGSSYWALRQSELPARITLVGTPVYHDRKQLQWSFGNARYPSDSSVTHTDSTLPFRRLDRKPIPDNIQVIWLLENNDWGDGKLREDAITRFYRHAFAREIGGNLVRMTPDLNSAFQVEFQTGFPPLDELKDSLPPRMITIQHLVPESSQTTTSEPPPELKGVFRQVADDPSQTLIAINWASLYPATDLDLWIRKSPGASELNYQNMTTEFGRLIRDVRQTGDVSNGDILGNWEVAVLKDVEPHELDCWLNAYEANGSPIQVKLITIWKGRKKTQDFSFNVEFGDRASAHDVRTQHNAWKQLEVTGS